VREQTTISDVPAFGKPTYDNRVAFAAELIDLARRAPSAGNTQACAFVVLEGDETARLWDVTLPAPRRAVRGRDQREPHVSQSSVHRLLACLLAFVVGMPDAYSMERADGTMSRIPGANHEQADDIRNGDFSSDHGSDGECPDPFGSPVDAAGHPAEPRHRRYREARAVHAARRRR
jgi:nitroreductase